MSVLAGVLAAAAVIAPAAPATQLFELPDPRITEASGIARGIVSPGVFYVQNDSGDSARFFAIDARDGGLRAVYRVPGAVNHDWEDIAVARDAAGTPSVWLADIGDNTAQRSEVQLYRVDEPHVPSGRTGAPLVTRRPDVWRLRYPSGPVNAESLAVTPTGRAYVLTKAASGRTVAYAVPPHPDPARVQVLQRMGEFTVPADAAPGLVPRSLRRVATGAAASPDGRLLAVRTYFEVFLWRLHGDDVAAALRTAPIATPLPLQAQGEGICFADQRLVVDSEGSGTPVWSLPLPPALRSPPMSSPRSPSTAARSSASAGAGASPSATQSGPSAPSSGSPRSPLLATLALIAAGCVWLAVRRLQRRG